jgi:hypothetical protein
MNYDFCNVNLVVYIFCSTFFFFFLIQDMIIHLKLFMYF